MLRLIRRKNVENISLKKVIINKKYFYYIIYIKIFFLKVCQRVKISYLTVEDVFVL